MKSLVSKVLVFAVFLSTPLLAAENNAKELSAQLTEMIKELEPNEHDVIKSFIKKYAINDELQELMTDKKLDQIVTEFMKAQKDELRQSLFAASKMVPNVSVDNMEYTYAKANDKSKTLKKNLMFVYSKKTKLFHIKN